MSTGPRGCGVYKHACALGCEGIVSKRPGSPYRPGRSHDWIKVKNPAAPAVKREADEDWSLSPRGSVTSKPPSAAGLTSKTFPANLQTTIMLLTVMASE
jgi:ATP dependent DNA ligase domain